MLVDGSEHTFHCCHPLVGKWGPASVEKLEFEYLLGAQETAIL